MNDISPFLSPLDAIKFDVSVNYQSSQLGKIISVYLSGNEFPDLNDVDLAIIGVEEDRKSVNNEGCALAPDYVRQELYQLYQGNYTTKIVDLGNIKRGHTIEDTYFALTSVCHELIKHKIIPIIIGGSQDLTFANYKAYEGIEGTVNIASVDSRLDLEEADAELTSRSYLGKIVLRQPNILFNYSNIGYQTYFVDTKFLDLMTNMYFDCYRLGHVRANIEDVEPIVRNADILSFDISSIRRVDAPANPNSSPNGFYGEEACQIVRYAGMSDKLSSVGFYEVNPSMDHSGQTAQLVAQMIWCFMDGYYNRKKDYPFKNVSDYTKYRVSIKDYQNEIIFYKSNLSDRWWMQVPYPDDKRLKYERHHLVPCSYKDYETACREEMPDRWWQTYQKLS